MIHQVPIKSLPQEWLWCETWCDDSSKKKAKTIDLVRCVYLCVWVYLCVCVYLCLGVCMCVCGCVCVLDIRDLKSLLTMFLACS